MKKFSLLLLATITFLSAFAQVPQGISYQAVAFNSGGSPVVNSNVGVKISVLDNSANGTVVYEETHTKLTNAQGLFNLNIGEGTPTLGTFAAINWATNSKFLKVEIDPAGGTNYTSVGTNQLMSVPYALHSYTVDNILASNIIGGIEPDSNGIALYTSSKAYAYSNGQWYEQITNGTPSEIISTSNVIGVITSSRAYAFSNGQWYEQITNGTPFKIVGNSGILGVITSSKAYSFSNGQWYEQTTNGSPQVVLAKRGVIFVYTSSRVYAFDKQTNQWHEQVLNGQVIDYLR